MKRKDNKYLKISAEED